MKTRAFMIATKLKDLAHVPVGTRIATSNNKLMIRGEFRGQSHWYEQGELSNYQPNEGWLPAIIIGSDFGQKTKKEGKGK